VIGNVPASQCPQFRKIIEVIALQLGKLDLTSLAGKLMLNMLSAVAEMERDLIVNFMSPKKDSTGLPGTLEESIESLSGISLKDVKIHFNSDMPTELNGDSYTQAEDIHVSPRQEQHLTHKAEHCAE